jgi:hypothetical protein
MRSFGGGHHGVTVIWLINTLSVKLGDPKYPLATQRFIDAAREAGCGEDEPENRENKRRIAMAKTPAKTPSDARK